MSRVYLDWNATAPLRPEARAAMIAAMDVVGNPSSVHAEGRAAKALVEKARGQVAELLGCDASEIVFTSGATEAAASVLNLDAFQWTCWASAVEHDCIAMNGFPEYLPSDEGGQVVIGSVLDEEVVGALGKRELFCLQTANSETGIRQSVSEFVDYMAQRSNKPKFLSDMVQSIGKVTNDRICRQIDFGLISGHKIGSAKGTGALFVRGQSDASKYNSLIQGGGQEMGRRSGTENVIGITGFGAAAAAAQRDLRDGVWERVTELRNILESALEAEAEGLIIFGRDVDRLPNTSCFAVPGWKGETQVMQMDLAGYAVSAGSACSSGKVKESRVLRAMGFDALTASSAIRVSLGPTTTEAEISGFVDAWSSAYRRWKARAA